MSQTINSSSPTDNEAQPVPGGIAYYMPVFIDPKYAQYFALPQSLQIPFSQAPTKEVALNDDLPESYDACADFSKSRYQMSSKKFWILRGLINVPMLWLAAYTLTGSKLKDLFFYESEWGVYLTAFSILLMLAAAFDKKSFQWGAVVTQAIAFGFNVVITPIFWIVLNFVVIDEIKKGNYWIAFIFAVHHLFPIAASLLNLWLNDEYCLAKDEKWVFLGGLLYVPTNYIGTKVEGHPLYPYPGDWSNPTLSLIVYVAQAFVLVYIQKKLVAYTKKVFPRTRL